MAKEIKYDYDSELDMLHVYSSDIDNGIKGCLSIGDFTIDVGQDNKIVGIEIEEASKVLNISSDILNKLDKVELIIKKIGNTLFIGVLVAKGQEKSAIQVTLPSERRPIMQKRQIYKLQLYHKY